MGFGAFSCIIDTGKVSSRYCNHGDAVYLWYDLQKCVVISKSCEPQTLDAVDSVLVNYLVSVRFIYKGQNDITYSDSFLHVVTLFGYLLTVHDT